jgi:hypothetical protein
MRMPVLAVRLIALHLCTCMWTMLQEDLPRLPR